MPTSPPPSPSLLKLGAEHELEVVDQPPAEIEVEAAVDHPTVTELELADLDGKLRALLSFDRHAFIEHGPPVVRVPDHNDGSVVIRVPALRAEVGDGWAIRKGGGGW